MPVRGEFGRASSGRGSSRGVRAAFRNASANGSLAASAKIIRSTDRVRAKVEKHFEKHAAKWTNKRYGELLLKAQISRAPAPSGMANDPKQRLMAQAQSQVAAKRVHRLERVERAQANMLQSGKIRATRKVDWGKGLGE